MTGNEGVSNCYVFKSRLQEYAQKVGLHTPVYETIKEGPSHEPFFRSTVVVNDVRYDSLTGFFNRKAAEQSAAEVALMELAKSSEDNKECIAVPVHETGLCKNLLQEYAQKMNYAIPLYDCKKDDAPGRMTLFTCTVEIGGMRYIGGAARNKKEAEIKAARTALLAIQSSSSGSTGPLGANSQLTVLPGKKRETESVKKSVETPSALKPKRTWCKKKKKTQGPSREARDKLIAESAGIPGSDVTGLGSLAMNQSVPESVTSPEVEVTDVNPSGGDVSAVKNDSQLGIDSVMKPEVEVSNGELQHLNGQSLASNDDQSNHENPNGQTPYPSNPTTIQEDANYAGETVKSSEDQSNHGNLNGQTPDPSNPTIHEDANNAGETVKSSEDQSNHGNLNGQTPQVPCEGLSNPDNNNVEEMAIGDNVKGQVAAEAPSAMAGLEQSGMSIEAGAE